MPSKNVRMAVRMVNQGQNTTPREQIEETGMVPMLHNGRSRDNTGQRDVIFALHQGEAI